MAHDRINIDPKYMMGKPVIKGTRITVEFLLRMLGKGHSVAELLDGYPGLAEDDIKAAQAYAADFLGDSCQKSLTAIEPGRIRQRPINLI